MIRNTTTCHFRELVYFAALRARNRSPGVRGEHGDNTSHPNVKFRRGLSNGRKNFSRFRFPRVLRWAGKQRIFKVVLDIFHRRMCSAPCLWHQHPYGSPSWNMFFTFSDTVLWLWLQALFPVVAYSPFRRLTKDAMSCSIINIMVIVYYSFIRINFIPLRYSIPTSKCM